MVILKMFPQKILDCGEIKILGDINMKSKDLYRECWLKSRQEIWTEIWDPGIGEYKMEEIRNENYKELQPKSKLKWFIEIKEKQIYDSAYMDFDFKNRLKHRKKYETMLKSSWDSFYEENKKDICKYLEIDIPVPFVTSVMINISPNWKGKFGVDNLTDKLMIKKFCQVIETYLKASNRYTKYKYVLECGSGGDHLHAHIVAEFNKSCIKSVTTHINKGNHTVELRKIWDKIFPEGYVGVCKGKYSIQRIILRVEELRIDKLKYLIENEKPEGHKNLRDLGILRNAGF